jgi:hypothetical protein
MTKGVEMDRHRKNTTGGSNSEQLDDYRREEGQQRIRKAQ